METTIKKKSILHSQADAAWKDMLELFLPDAIAFCFPELNSHIDWDKKWEFLDQEFRAITNDSVEGKRLVDKLIKVFRRNGSELWLLIHIEIQGSRDNFFPTRMFIYHYRIYDKYGRHPVSCAILTDDSKSWYPVKYHHKEFDCELSFKFPMFKILDMQPQQQVLEDSINPVASIILAQMETIKSKNKSPNERLIIKYKLTKRLYAKGFSPATVRALYHFIDSLIHLPKPLEIEYEQTIYQLEETNGMRYVSTIEKMGIEKGIQRGIQKGIERGIEQGIQKGMQQGIQQGMQQGIQQGMQHGKQEIAFRMLEKGYTSQMISELTGLDQNEISKLQKQEPIIA